MNCYDLGEVLILNLCCFIFAFTDVSKIKDPDERVAIIQKQLSELRKIYMQLKAEVASIDRRRKKFRRKEREGKITDKDSSHMKNGCDIIWHLYICANVSIV